MTATSRAASENPGASAPSKPGATAALKRCLEARHVFSDLIKCMQTLTLQPCSPALFAGIVCILEAVYTLWNSAISLCPERETHISETNLAFLLLVLGYISLFFLFLVAAPPARCRFALLPLPLHRPRRPHATLPRRFWCALDLAVSLFGSCLLAACCCLSQ